MLPSSDLFTVDCFPLPNMSEETQLFKQAEDEASKKWSPGVGFIKHFTAILNSMM
jgi:hypothetical protein